MNWLPMGSAPKDYSRILIRHNIGNTAHVHIGHWFDNAYYEGWEIADKEPDDESRFIDNPTGWMPIPPP